MILTEILCSNSYITEIRFNVRLTQIREISIVHHVFKRATVHHRFTKFVFVQQNDYFLL